METKHKTSHLLSDKFKSAWEDEQSPNFTQRIQNDFFGSLGPLTMNYTELDYNKHHFFLSFKIGLYNITEIWNTTHTKVNYYLNV